MNKFRDLTLVELIEALGHSEKEETIHQWVTEGLPQLSGLPGRYDQHTSWWWSSGWAFCSKVRDLGEFSTSQLVAIGWLQAPAVEVPQRLVDTRLYLDLQERIGVDSVEAITSLSQAMIWLDSQGGLPGREPRPDGLGGQIRRSH